MLSSALKKVHVARLFFWMAVVLLTSQRHDVLLQGVQFAPAFPLCVFGVGTYLPVWIGLEALNEAAKKGHSLIVKDLARSREQRLKDRASKRKKISSGADSFGF